MKKYTQSQFMKDLNALEELIGGYKGHGGDNGQVPMPDLGTSNSNGYNPVKARARTNNILTPPTGTMTGGRRRRRKSHSKRVIKVKRTKRRSRSRSPTW